MNQPTLDYWTGPAQPPAWRTALIWPFMLGIASGVFTLLVLQSFLTSAWDWPLYPDCCLLVMPTVILCSVGTALLLGASEIRIRLLGRKFDARPQWCAWTAGLLYPVCLLVAAYFAKFLHDEVPVIILLACIFVSYPFVAGVALIRPLHELTSLAPILPEPPPDSGIPTAQLAPPPQTSIETKTTNDESNPKSQ